MVRFDTVATKRKSLHRDSESVIEERDLEAIATFFSSDGAPVK